MLICGYRGSNEVCLQWRRCLVLEIAPPLVALRLLVVEMLLNDFVLIVLFFRQLCRSFISSLLMRWSISFLIKRLCHTFPNALEISWEMALLNPWLAKVWNNEERPTTYKHDLRSKTGQLSFSTLCNQISWWCRTPEMAKRGGNLTDLRPKSPKNQISIDNSCGSLTTQHILIIHPAIDFL